MHLIQSEWDFDRGDMLLEIFKFLLQEVYIFFSLAFRLLLAALLPLTDEGTSCGLGFGTAISGFLSLLFFPLARVLESD
jgi:hypothetical protein